MRQAQATRLPLCWLCLLPLHRHFHTGDFISLFRQNRHCNKPVFPGSIYFTWNSNRLAWPLRKDDTQKSRMVSNFLSWQERLRATTTMGRSRPATRFPPSTDSGTSSATSRQCTTQRLHYGMKAQMGKCTMSRAHREDSKVTPSRCCASARPSTPCGPG